MADLLSMSTQIAAANIVNIRCFKKGVVYLISGTDGSELVIKCDAPDDNMMKQGTKAIKAVDPLAKNKVLTATEKQELDSYCQFVIDLDDYFADIRSWLPSFYADGQRQTVAAKELRNSIANAPSVSKMIKQQVHNIEDAARQRGNGSKELMQKMVAGLKKDGGLEYLGGIVAADLFNGNTDRFYPGSAQQVQIGPFTFNVKVIVNFGNVMMVTAGDTMNASGLDYVDGNQFRYFQPLVATEQSVEEKWPGRILADSKKRRSFADDIIHDLEALFNPKKSKFSLRTKLGMKAASRLDRGMKEGARKIRISMQGKPNLSQGMKDRPAVIANV